MEDRLPLTSATIFLLFGLFTLTNCKSEKHEKKIALFNTHCAACHNSPKIEEIPKAIWKNRILPDMFSRMDVVHIDNDTYQGPFNSKLPSSKPRISLTDMIMLEEFIIDTAPKVLATNTLPEIEILAFFEEVPIALDGQNGSIITSLNYSNDTSEIYFGTATGELNSFSLKNRTVSKKFQGETPITWFNLRDSIIYITEVGLLNPSDEKLGLLSTVSPKITQSKWNQLQRPVHTLAQDLNENGKDEFVISEFGNETGKLSMLIEDESKKLEKTVLLNQPGCIRTIAKDMNADNRLDLVVLTSQGKEGITILYQDENFKFDAVNVVNFSPVYGSSWFELVDYNKDGYLDIITVNGDNADKSYVQKPYHGMRIHLNDGNNNFKEVFFYPLNGATRVVTHDFDKDGDLDFGLLSSFPDYERAPEMSFVYLENLETKKFKFKTRILSEPNAGRWFLMDKGDVDQDGDMDIILSSFTDVFSPTPKELIKQWSKTNVDLLVLKNALQ